MTKLEPPQFTFRNAVLGILATAQTYVAPNATLGATTAGQISTTLPARIMQASLKFNFWGFEPELNPQDTLHSLFLTLEGNHDFRIRTGPGQIDRCNNVVDVQPYSGPLRRSCQNENCDFPVSEILLVLETAIGRDQKFDAVILHPFSYATKTA